MVHRAGVNQHHLEKFRDLYVADQVFGAKKIWQRRVKDLEMTVFQESLISRGLMERHDEEARVSSDVDTCLGFSAVLSAECLEAVDRVSEEVTHHDLLVSTSCWLLVTALMRCSSASTGQVGVGEVRRRFGA